MLEIERVSVSYGHHRALEDVSLHLRAGEIVTLLGANGAGKSTLLKAITGLVRKSGNVRLNGVTLSNLPPHLIVESGIALVPEGRGVFAQLTVLENLMLGAYAARARAREDENLDHVLTLFPRLRERLKQSVGTMSGGEQQMVAIARALMSNPSFLLLDEPSLGLSPLICSELFAALKNIRSREIGILLVEQNAKRSLEIADRGYLLENGMIAGEGEASDLLSRGEVHAAYLGVGEEEARTATAH